MVSSTLGSPTKTCWKRRSSAASFSMCSRYSSSVVAPIIRSSPRASIGLSMLPASIAESPVAPAPTTVCSSSMNVMILAVGVLDLLEHGLEPLLELAAVLRARRPSRRGRATAAVGPCSDSGTSPATMRWARPSTTAVLPTPGSPIRTGLFLVRRDSTWTTRRISLSRPITGSSVPCSASAVRSTAYFSSASYVPSGSGLVTRCDPRTVSKAPSQRVGGRAGAVEELLGGAVDGRERDQQVLGRDVLVAERLGELLGGCEHLDGRPRVRRRRDRRCRRPPAACASSVGGLGRDRCRVDAGGAQQRAGDAVGLARAAPRADAPARPLGLPGRVRELDGGADRLLAAAGELVGVHVCCV